MDEFETRKALIDHRLSVAGWRIGDASQVVEEYRVDLERTAQWPMRVAETATPTAREGLADYALLRRGRVVAVVEAKRTSIDARLGQEQALQYARGVQRDQAGPPPFVLYTNGQDIFFWDVDVYPPVRVAGFPTPDDLEWFEQRRESRRPLSAELIDTRIAGRDYQIGAIRAILETFESKRRTALLVMATGTGKTRTAMALIDVLQRAHWARRVLFLVDRLALEEQAIQAFREHLPESPHWPRSEGAILERDWAANRRLYCTTYPTMLNLIEASVDQRDYLSPHFFDLVIADESHRSIYNVYRRVLDWFSGLTLGLTATPKDHIDQDTFALFDCEPGLPTFAYSFQEAVEHAPPYLCDFQVLKIRSRFQLEGIRGATLSRSIRQRLVDEGKDPESIDFEGTDLERSVTNSGTNALLVREFMEESIKDPTGTLPGKSIVFAISKAHARRIAEIFDALFPEHAGNLARVLVSEDRFVHGKGGLLDQFENQDFPRVAISVDMLDTGVDVPEVVNLVFAKPVYSYSKFWQMIGRGTRILPAPGRRKPWCPEKDAFLVLDCWGNFDYFQMNPRGKEPREEMPMPVRLFRARLDLLELARACGRGDAADFAIAGLRADLDSLPPSNAIVSAHGAELSRTKAEGFWETPTAADLGLLRMRIAPLLRTRSRLDPRAMRFETQIVELATARLDGDAAQEAARASDLASQVDELPGSVNLVRAERPLVDEAGEEAWWRAASLQQLSDAARRLAPLMRLRTRPAGTVVALDLDDVTAIKETVERGSRVDPGSLDAWKARVEAHVRALLGRSQALRRIAVGEEPTEQEISEVSSLLRELDPGASAEFVRRLYDVRTSRLDQLLRHVLGLERHPTWTESVTRAFDEFVSDHNDLSEIQIRFLQTLRAFLISRRRVERRDLVEAPFTQIHPQGIRGVFQGSAIEEVVKLAEGLVA